MSVPLYFNIITIKTVLSYIMFLHPYNFDTRGIPCSFIEYMSNITALLNVNGLV